VDAAGCFGVGHALHAVHAGLELEFCEHAAAGNFGDNFLETALGALRERDHLGLPALLGRVALVHAE
jgi:hypothetical protein